MLATKAWVGIKYDNGWQFELASRSGRTAGKLRRYIAWPFISLGMAILFGMNGWEWRFGEHD